MDGGHNFHPSTMQNAGPTGFGVTSAFQRNLGARITKDDIFRAEEMDENAPPDPSRAVEDEIPVASFGSSRMIGALNSRASTPMTISALHTPTRGNNLQLRPTASTLAGSVVAVGVTNTRTISPEASSLVKKGIVFRSDPNMVTTFDKKVDGELYDLWNA